MNQCTNDLEVLFIVNTIRGLADLYIDQNE